ncbi:hypothetical protein [Lelliottia wanjuensis]|uniref:Uncharacterized protein n=1 Tax=Lelliottia wanjuensis TaxID=3050585 RepID=A0AAP4D315_9ENTR|nr:MULTISPECIES: hypothetical protein [unclassified Lelliottia]MDK9364164.1 hypothetical protein [Lelliottia sp. V106_12]MDK9617159.1 hypothetical protein [Lelliottia sp. V106_9]
MGQIYNSEAISMAAGGGDGGVTVTVLESGEFNTITAEPGVYYLKPGVTIENCPDNLIAVFHALVTVRIKGESVNLILHAHFNQTSGYIHCGEWELMPDGSAYLWSSLGPGDSSNPSADKDFLITATIQSGRGATGPAPEDYYAALLAGKVYGLLTPEEDAALENMTTQALSEFRSAFES